MTLWVGKDPLSTALTFSEIAQRSTKNKKQPQSSPTCNPMNTIEAILFNCIHKSAGWARPSFAFSLCPQLLNTCTYITRSERRASTLDYMQPKNCDHYYSRLKGVGILFSWLHCSSYYFGEPSLIPKLLLPWAYNTMIMQISALLHALINANATCALE